MRADSLWEWHRPWAIDGNGNPIDTRYEVDDEVITQWVDLASATAFPVVADPYLGINLGIQGFLELGSMASAHQLRGSPRGHVQQLREWVTRGMSGTITRSLWAAACVWSCLWWPGR